VKTIEQTQKRAPGLSGFTLERFAGLGIQLFAFAWPLGAYQRVAGPVHLHHIALVPIFLCALADFKRNKRLRTPFELWWPCVVIAVLAMLLHAGGHAAPPWRVAGLCALFVAVTHVARNRRAILRALQFSCISGCAVVIMSLLAQFNALFPTAYSVGTGHVMAGPYSVREGVLSVVFLLLLTPALWAAARRREFAPCRFAVAGWVVLPVGALLYGCLSPRPELEALRPAHIPFLLPGVFAVTVFLWAVARIAAKLWVARQFLGPGVYAWLVAALAAGVVVAVWCAPMPTAGFIFLLAIVAGYGQPRVAAGTSARFVPIMIALVASLATVNIMLTLPGDPRNYERFARAALATGTTDEARERLGFVKKLAPTETRADYYIARIHLAEGNLAAAAKVFARSLRDTHTRLLPPPDAALIAEFLDEMREKSSALPEQARGLAYEKALIAAGREQHALSLLELRGESSPLSQVPGNSDDTERALSRPPAAALAALLETPSLADALTLWNARLLAAIIESAGPHSKVASVPEGFPESMLPLVVMARVGAGADEILMFSPAGQAGGIRCPDAPLRRTPPADAGMMLGEPEWREWRRNAEGVWTLAFGIIGEVHILGAPEVFFGSYPSPIQMRLEETWRIRVFMPGQEEP